MSKFRYACLFSGIGAPLQAAHRVYGKENIDHIFSCEWDKFARQSFKAIYEIEDEHFHKDINDMDGKQYADKVDCIIGGSPCQDFSIAGLRAGVDGKRGNLIWQYFRIIDEVRPPVFIYENVKGMISDGGGKTIKNFLEVFRSIGYYCHWGVLNSKDYGVPQNRERVFIVGFLDHEAYYRFQFAQKIPLTKRLKDVLENDVDEKYYLSAKMTDYLAKPNRSIPPFDGSQEISPCLQAVYYKTPTDGFYINEGIVNRIRKLTPLECWRLQDFPDEAHEKAKASGVSDSQRYKQAGNSITVAVMEMILRQVEKAIKGNKSNSLLDWMVA